MEKKYSLKKKENRLVSKSKTANREKKLTTWNTWRYLSKPEESRRYWQTPRGTGRVSGSAKMWETLWLYKPNLRLSDLSKLYDIDLLIGMPDSLLSLLFANLLSSYKIKKIQHLCCPDS